MQISIDILTWPMQMGLALIILNACSISQAALIDEIYQPPLEMQIGRWVSASYLWPNERNPGWLMNILRIAGPGLHFSVGTERGFVGFAMSPTATGLVLIDKDPHVVLFNRINTALLAVSSDLAHYRQLRFATSQTHWLATLTMGAPETIATLLSAPQTYGVWRELIAQFEDLNPYSGAGNYLEQNRLYERLAAAARMGQILPLQLDLGDDGSLKSLLEDLTSKGYRIAVFDISNAWVRPYLTSKQVRMVAELVLNRFGDANTRLVTTQSDPSREWRYRSLTARDIQNVSSLQHLIARRHRYRCARVLTGSK